MPASVAQPRSHLVRALVVCALLLASCLGPGAGAPPPVSEGASQAFARARELRAAGALPEDPALLQALAEARALAPEWVAPRRMEDDLLVAGQRGPDALDRRRVEAGATTRDARLTYLIARLEGPAAQRRFEQALALDPGFAWAHHGLSWSLQRQREERPALEHARRAVELARDPWERAYFQLARARRLRAFRQEDAALELLRAALEGTDDLRPADRAWFATEVALFEVASNDLQAARAGYARGLELVRSEALSRDDLARLTVELFTRAVGGDFEKLELELALAAHDSELRRELRANWLYRSSASALASALFERDGHADSRAGGGLTSAVTAAAALTRLEAFERGHYAEAVESWLAALPEQVLAGDGLPAREVLRQVVRCARALRRDSHGEALERFGEALLAAGWFAEAQSVSDALAGRDLDEALALRERAVAGRVLFDGLTRTLLDVERGRPDLAASVSFSPGPRDDSESAAELDDSAPGPQEVSSGGLDDLLSRWALLFARSATWLGGESDEQVVRAALLDSPRLTYGPFASVVHPGAKFSREDAAAGRGHRGDPVPGLAPRLERYGRFAIVGEVLGGGGPDGTLLRLLSLEEREGEHLGVPWSGTIAWCEGADLLSRAGRRGARISGAALHEGYWIDIDSVRGDQRRWDALRASYAGERGRQRLDAALGVRGLALFTPAAQAEQRRRERMLAQPLLGEADRVRLAVLRERASGDELLGAMRLGELVDSVARHEEGHLCDRTRFFPISRHLGRIARLLFDSGFSPLAIQQQLEYRAHLNSLCVARDARLPLVELLDTADSNTAGGLPHGAAYRQLLVDLIAVLDLNLERSPAEWSTIDPRRTLVHQLHRLSSEEVRSLALTVAGRKGLID